MSRIKSVRFISWPRCTTRSEAPWPAPARAWQPGNPNGPEAGRARRPQRRQPVRTSGSPGNGLRCAPLGICLSNGTCTQPHGRSWGVSAVGCPSYRRCVRSWTRSTRCVSDAVGPRPRAPNSPPCGGVCSGARHWATPSRSSFPPRWRKRSRFLTTRYCLRPRTRWSGATGAIAKCKRVSIGCGRKNRSVHVLRWTCGVKPKLKAVNKPLHHCIVHGLDNPGSSATVSSIFYI
jgi:hypothetical protein